MDFNLTDEQELLLESLDEWLDRTVTEQKIQEWYAAHGIPDEVSKSFLDAGFGMMGLPEEVGGVPFDMMTKVTFIEEMGRKTCAALPLTNNVLGAYLAVHFGNEDQQKMVFDEYLSNGKSCVSLATSEPEAGSDSANMSTVVTETSDGLILNGQKTWVTDALEASFMLVVAKDEDPSRDNRNISMWLIPRETEGVSINPLHKIGSQVQSLCEVYLDNVHLDESNLFGVRGSGFKQLMHTFETDRLSVSAQCLGLAQGALEDAAKYAGQRVTFGKPIYKHQMIQEKLADMEIKCRNMRNMLYRTAWERDNGKSIALSGPLTKRYCAMTSLEVCNEAMQIFGGIGYTTESRTGRAYLDCRAASYGAGTNEIMAYIAGKQIVGLYS